MFNLPHLRKLRSKYTKNWEPSPAEVKEGAVFANGKYRVRQTSCPAQSEWFHDFLRGLEYRMGCQSDPLTVCLWGRSFTCMQRRQRSLGWS